MTKQKKEFIQNYIDQLYENISDYSNLNASGLYDYIEEVLGVFSKEFPDLRDYLSFKNDSACLDTKILIGLLEKEIIEDNEFPFEDSNSEKFMDIINQLKVEVGGFKTILLSYSPNSTVINYITQLERALENIDIKSIKYCLSEIKAWYYGNINKILSNEWCFDKDEHKINMHKIEKFHDKIKEIPDSFSTRPNNTIESMDSKPVIFLSHCSKDKRYGDALEKFIVDLGVKESQLIYSSHPLHKIPLDNNIYEYLRKNINKNVFMIILWSNDYLQSPACLNEMGAAWVVQSDYTNIYVPDFDFGNPKYRECAVDTNKMGAVLNGNQNCRVSMLELKDKIEAIFSLKNDEKKVSVLLDDFLENIK